MQEQKKSLNSKKKSIYSKKIGWKNEIQLKKAKIRKRRIFKNRLQVLNPTFQRFLVGRKNNGIPSKKLNIRITPNNVFCTLKNIKKKKTTYVSSSGISKVKTSKKTLRYSTKIVVGHFLRTVKKELNTKQFIVDLAGPIRIRKAVLKQLAKYFKKSSLILNVESKKCFNGCRAPKKRRKKQKGLRVLK
jgi:ribosomal protein S11